MRVGSSSLLPMVCHQSLYHRVPSVVHVLLCHLEWLVSLIFFLTVQLLVFKSLYLTTWTESMSLSLSLLSFPFNLRTNDRAV